MDATNLGSAEIEALDVDATVTKVDEIEASEIDAAADACKTEESLEAEAVELFVTELVAFDEMLVWIRAPLPLPLLAKARDSSKAATARTISSAAGESSMFSGYG